LRILYLSSGSAPDYLCDMIFHGLREHFGPDVVDLNRLAYMYKGAELKDLYGKGFTLYGLIEEGEVDRSDIPAKIEARYFDLVIFGSIQRCHELVYNVISSYPKEKIVFLDGEDNPLYLRDLPKHGLYFKRELHTPQPQVFPIQFSIPEEKIVAASRKGPLMAPLDPLNPATYIYENEEEYYDSYRSALFGKTMKKAGWDCLRHYEIMACECIPYFENLEFCPPTVMINLPKQELLIAKLLFDYQGIDIFHRASGRELWADLMARIGQTLKEKLTTKAMAKYVIDMAWVQQAKTVANEIAYA